MTTIFEGIDGKWLELKLEGDEEHYRCKICGDICLKLTHDYLICIDQEEFDRFADDMETCVWKDVDPETLNVGVCPGRCRPGEEV